MDEFFKLASSPLWWFTALVLAVLLNLGSEYLKRLLDFAGGLLWTRWRDRTEASKKQYADNVHALREDTNLQFLLLLKAIQLRGSANSWLLVAVLMFLFSVVSVNLELTLLVVQAVGRSAESEMRWPILSFVAGAACTLISASQSLGATYRERMVMQAQFPQKL